MHYPRNCALCAERELKNTKQAFRVVGKSIPQDVKPEIRRLAGKEVCQPCSGLLRNARIRTYNVQKAEDRKAQDATSTIADLLAHQNAQRGIIALK